eukprot:COSAG06_NODE_12483_length_1375_cov_12.536050_3_plen_98_part_01
MRIFFVFGCAAGIQWRQWRYPGQSPCQLSVSLASYSVASSLQSVESTSHSRHSDTGGFVRLSAALPHTLWFDAAETLGRIDWLLLRRLARCNLPPRRC